MVRCTNILAGRPGARRRAVHDWIFEVVSENCRPTWHCELLRAHRLAACGVQALNPPSKEIALRVQAMPFAPLNWPTTLMFTLTFAVAVLAVPWYGLTHGYHASAWIWFALLLGANGMAITCGYHRLWAHATYDAHPLLKLAYLLFGAMALQNSAPTTATIIALSTIRSAIHTVRALDSGSRTSAGCCAAIRAATSI